MTDLNKKNSFEKSREHLANERTFLAWIRTSIALMGFGFVIEKFALFLKEISLVIESDALPAKGYSSMIGVIMVALGLIIAILAFLQYKRYEKQLNNNTYFSSSLLSMIMLAIILIGGVLLIFYLLANL